MSATVIEATRTGLTTYEMPDWLLAAYKRGIDARLFKRMATFIALLPVEFRKLVKIGPEKPYPKPEKPKFSWVLYDELATPEEIQRALDWMNKK